MSCFSDKRENGNWIELAQDMCSDVAL